jgi:hypothetical protein|tara:strand:+ start:650 stop:850 length:201 start_codon:yes stop_codon:yes gene_type:complete
MISNFFLTIIFIAYPSVVFAYLDGGFLSMILQFIVAFIAMGIVYLKLTITKIGLVLRKIKSFFKIK